MAHPPHRGFTMIGNENRRQAFLFSNFLGASGISRQNPGISRQKSLVSLVSRDIPNFSAPTPSRGKPPPPPEDIRTKKFGSRFLLLPKNDCNFKGISGLRAKGERDNFFWNLEWCRDHHLHKVKFDILYMAPCSQQRKNKTAHVRAWASSTSITLNAFSCATDLGTNLLNGKPQNRSSTQTNAALEHMSAGILQAPQVIKHI